MAGWRQAVALAMTGEEIEALTALKCRGRGPNRQAGCRGQRCCSAIGRSHRSLPWDEDLACIIRRLQRCVERAMAYGALAALDDRPRPGKEPTIPPVATAGVVSLACATRPRSTAIRMNCGRHGFWPRHARERGPAAGHQCLARLAQGTVCKLLGQEGNQAAQGALLSGTPRRRVRAQDGGSSVCLPRRSRS